MSKLVIVKKALISVMLCFLMNVLVSSFAFGYIEYLPKETQELVKLYKTDHTYEGLKKSHNLYSKFYFESNPILNPLIIVTGLEDPIPAWFRVVSMAKKKGFKYVYVVELRGQGQSERVLGQSNKLLHVENFDDYEHDLLAAFNDISKRLPPDIPRPYVLSHSTGASVVGNSLEALKEMHSKVYPLKMSFWTPLVKLKMSPFLKNGLVQSVLSVLSRVSLFFGYPIKVRNFKAIDFSESHVTTSREQHQLAQKLRFEGGLGSSGVSLHWGIQALKGTQKLREQALPQIMIPTLVLLAENEMVVDNDFKIENDKIKIQTIRGTKHAIHIEKEAITEMASTLTFDFFLND